MTRRTYLTLLVNGGAATAAAVIAVPSAIHMFSPVVDGHRGEDWRPLGPLQDFSVHEVQAVVVSRGNDEWPPAFEPLAVYVWRSSETELVVYSRRCTDLACPLNYDVGSNCFFCPCHGGIFGKNGERMAGPPNRPMYRYACRVRDGVVEIDVNSLPPIG